MSQKIKHFLKEKETKEILLYFYFAFQVGLMTRRRDKRMGWEAMWNPTGKGGQASVHAYPQYLLGPGARLD